MTDPAPDLAELAATVAQLCERMGDTRTRLRFTERRLREVGHTRLLDRFDQLAREVRDALDQGAPRGPAAPRWDSLDPAARAAQLAALANWVDMILVPGWVTGGSYTLAACWARHEQALWELGTIWARWRQAYARPRPDLGLALEWQDRWLPGAMRHIADATSGCLIRHQDAPARSPGRRLNLNSPEFVNPQLCYVPCRSPSRRPRRSPRRG